VEEIRPVKVKRRGVDDKSRWMDVDMIPKIPTKKENNNNNNNNEK